MTLGLHNIHSSAQRGLAGRELSGRSEPAGEARPSLIRPSSVAVNTRLFRHIHEHLMDAIQAGRADDAYTYARLLAYLGPRQ